MLRLAEHGLMQTRLTDPCPGSHLSTSFAPKAATNAASSNRALAPDRLLLPQIGNNQHRPKPGNHFWKMFAVWPACNGDRDLAERTTLACIGLRCISGAETYPRMELQLGNFLDLHSSDRIFAGEWRNLNWGTEQDDNRYFMRSRLRIEISN
jgi:hypothetical protein